MPSGGRSATSCVQAAATSVRAGTSGLGPAVCCGSAGFDRIGLFAAEQGGAIVLVALRIAAGEGEAAGGESRRLGCRWCGESVEEVQQVGGARSGGSNAEEEVNGVVSLGELLQLLLELGLAVGVFDEGEFGGGELEVVAEEDGLVAVACGVDADAEAHGGSGSLRVGWLGWSHGVSGKSWCAWGRSRAAPPFE